MCIIIASPNGAPISAVLLADAASSNRDGGGCAWLQDDKIEYRKGLDAKGIAAVLKKDMPKNAAHIVHFRIATVGGVREELTHPFPIGPDACLDINGNCDKVLFHNGQFGDWKKLVIDAACASRVNIPPGPWSDSRGMAFLCAVMGKHVIGLLDSSSRYVVFDATEKADRRMFLWGAWPEKDGLRFSHQGSCAFREPTKDTFHKPALPRSVAAQKTAGEEKEMSREEETPTRQSSPRGMGMQTGGTKQRVYKPMPGFSAWVPMTPSGTELPTVSDGINVSP